jgi:hypothetical protein
LILIQLRNGFGGFAVLRHVALKAVCE